MWKYYNPNPKNKMVGDCVIRAVSKALGESWQDVYADITIKAYILADMPSSDAVLTSFLRGKGFVTVPLPDTCPECYTLEDFCKDHPRGTFIVKLPDHVVCVEDGCAYDSWNSLSEMPLFYFKRRNI